MALTPMARFGSVIPQSSRRAPRGGNQSAYRVAVTTIAAAISNNHYNHDRQRELALLMRGFVLYGFFPWHSFCCCDGHRACHYDSSESLNSKIDFALRERCCSGAKRRRTSVAQGDRLYPRRYDP